MDLYVGTSGYSYAEWRGPFYPEKLPGKQMLHYYGTQFRTVEVNYTFRGMPKPSVFEAWAGEVPSDFKFVLKAPMRITHIRRLKDVKEPVAEMLAVARVLKKRLGPLLFQLPPNFKKDVERLRGFLNLLPKSSRPAFEFRHQSWYDDDVLDLLRKHKASLCIAEAENDLQIPFVATADWGYVRLRNPEYTDNQLRQWVKKIQAEKWKDVFVFFKHEDAGIGPAMAMRFLRFAEKE